MPARFVDAFAGAGGMSIGLKSAGFELVKAFDLDDIAIRTQKLNNPKDQDKYVVADICDLLSTTGLEHLGIEPRMVDFVVGGPPCQGFSVQRTIGSDDDLRNELVIKFMEFVSLVEPRFFLMENVPALAGKRGRAILDKALAYIAGQGYLTQSVLLDASDFGVPQRRRRRFILGERTSSPFMSVSLPQSRVTLRTVRSAIGHYPPPPEDGSDHPNIKHHRRDKLSQTNLQRISHLQAGQGRENLPSDLLASCHQRTADQIGHRKVYGRMSWDEVAPTITARFDSFTRGQFGHPEQNRTISLREGATLQTFPEEYEFVGNKVDIARQIGNAVPPLLAKAIGEHLLKQLR